MDPRIVAALIGFGIVVGFVIRSSIKFLMKVVIVLVALIAVHVISPDGIPDMIRQGLAWVYQLVTTLGK